MSKVWNIISVAFFLFLLVTPLLFIDKPKILLFINENHSPLLNFFFKSLSSIGNAVSAVLICIIFLLSEKLKYFIQFLLSFVIQMLFVLPLKHIFFDGSYRPFKYFKMYHDENLLNLVDGVKIYYFDTFPSGHTATIFFICTFLALFYNKRLLTCFLFILAFLVGMSRIYLVQHFFIDVYFGATIGIFSSVASFVIIERNYKVCYEIRVFPKFQKKIRAMSEILRFFN